MQKEMNIALEGRELVKFTVLEQTADKVVSVSEYSDGTIVKFYQEAGNISVECNKDLVIQEDGKTVKIVG
ncbi:hypothetical protein [Bacillus pseudomycoides]|uniref:hypothetical protein n=1 Tax=Bacillus pseudomycoides TaxID=64104 RepID=UPI0011560820|nr:hypothetical protein [Bacillus pseudomycoides]